MQTKRLGKYALPFNMFLHGLIFLALSLLTSNCSLLETEKSEGVKQAAKSYIEDIKQSKTIKTVKGVLECDLELPHPEEIETYLSVASKKDCIDSVKSSFRRIILIKYRFPMKCFDGIAEFQR